jgi:glycosyltransferase involved in cell wall biosynthesis
MRIALVIYGSLETISGGYLYDRKLVEHLRRQGEEVEVVSLPWRSYASHLADNLSAELARRLARLDVDILLQDELNHPSLFGLNRRIRQDTQGHKLPIAAIVHHLRCSELHPASLLPLYRWVERSYLLSLDGLIYNSQTTRQSVARLTGQQTPGVIAYPAGDQFQPQIDPAQIRTRALEPGPLRVLFVGNLIRRKGVDLLLAALSRMPPGAATLTVVGGSSSDPAYARSLRRQAAASDLSRWVTFLGPLQGAQLAAQYRMHQVLAVPSSYEGFGIAYLEGMGFGLPAVATDRGAAGEVITHGENGFRVPPGDVDALRDVLHRLAEHRETLAAMGLAARQRFLRHPTWEQTGAVIHAYLKGML